jgi:uncharacterized membrane protein YsdA (DUF1294 family)
VLNQSDQLLVYVFVATSIAAFVLCGLDKRLAILGWNRIPEIVLYLAALLGGSFGLLLGMHLFRHKTQKASFQVVIVLIALLQIYLAQQFLR